MNDSSALIPEPGRVPRWAACCQSICVPPDVGLAGGVSPAQPQEFHAGEVDGGPSGASFTAALAIAAGPLPLLWPRAESAERQSRGLQAIGLTEVVEAWGRAPAVALTATRQLVLAAETSR